VSFLKGRTRKQKLLVVLAVTLFVGCATAAVVYYREQDRIATMQAQEFYADLVTKGFDRDATTVAWKDDTDCDWGECKTANRLIATTIIAGCVVQVERSEADANDSPPIEQGIRQMKLYWLDEYVDGSRNGRDLEGIFALAVRRPTAKLVHGYVTYFQGHIFSKCFDAAAPAPTI
jgi:hypothetical protein